MTYSIQMAQIEDIRPAAELISRYLGTMLFVPAEENASLDEIVAINEPAVRDIIDNLAVAKTSDNRIVGTAGLMNNKEGDVYGIGLKTYQEVVGFAVDEAFRRQGIAGKMLELLLQKASKDIVVEAWGDTGKEANLHHILLNHGFSRIKRLENFYQNRGDCFLCCHRNKCNKQLCTCDIYLKKL